MRPLGEPPMKVLMTKRFLAMRSHASKPCLSIRELAGTRFTSIPVMPGGTSRRNRGQNFFRFTYFQGPSTARPLEWPLRMTNGKVRFVGFVQGDEALIGPIVGAFSSPIFSLSMRVAPAIQG